MRWQKHTLGKISMLLLVCFALSVGYRAFNISCPTFAMRAFLTTKTNLPSEPVVAVIAEEKEAETGSDKVLESGAFISCISVPTLHTIQIKGGFCTQEPNPVLSTKLYLVNLRMLI